ncbi:MAG: STAS domain-containing protein [Planctomycetota bacterium]
MGLDMSANVDDSKLLVTLEGELTRPESIDFKNWVLGQMEAAEPSRIEVDCKQLSYVDSAGLGSLIFFHKLAADRQAQLCLVNISGWLAKFLHVTGLERTFTDTKTEATPQRDDEHEGQAQA